MANGRRARAVRADDVHAGLAEQAVSAERIRGAEHRGKDDSAGAGQPEAARRRARRRAAAAHRGRARERPGGMRAGGTFADRRTEDVSASATWRGRLALNTSHRDAALSIE